MIRFASFAAVAILSASSAQAVVVVGQLYNTGVGINGAALASGNGQTDANYKITDATHAGAVVGTSAKTYYFPSYVPDDSGSRWVAFDGNIGGIPASPGLAPVGYYDLTTTFDLTDFYANTAKITGLWGVDNNGEIFLNGASTGVVLTGTVQSSFRTLADFSIANGFVSGLNTLTLRVTNNGGPTAGRFDNLVLTASVPEPESWAMLIAGFGLVGAAARRRRSQPARALA